MGPSDAWLEGIPDLVLQLSRDGSVIKQTGGRLCSLPSELPASWRTLLRQLTRRAVANRGTALELATHGERQFEIRVTAQSPDRAIGMVRTLSGGSGSRDEPPDPHAQRRQFWQRLTESISKAILGERSFALAIIHLDGLADISQLIESDVADQLIALALQRLGEPAATERWFVGQTRRDELAVIFDHVDRGSVDSCLQSICHSLRARLDLGDASYHLKPYSGVAILGQDATSQTGLLDSARAAAAEARRCDAGNAYFFSDTLKLRALTRLDIAQELREALANRDIKLRFRPRHDFQSGRLVALAAYARWQHPVRGEIPPERFLGAAAATGLAAALSRAMWQFLCEEASQVLALFGDQVRVSFGPLRHHVTDGAFIEDVETSLRERRLDAARLELRIAERVHATRESTEWRGLADRGVQFVVDEVGRQFSSLERLAKAPLWGLQLDRAAAMSPDPAARKVCRAVVGMARGMMLVPIATGVDTPAQQRYLASIGCEQGSGDHYSATLPAEFPSTSRQFSNAT